MQDKVIVITGAFGALGQALVTAALDCGATVAALDHASTGPVDVRAQILGGVDLTEPASAQAAVDRVIARHGRLDVLLNAVGGFVWQTTMEGVPDAWSRMHQLNGATVLNACRAALPALIASGDGRIVNVGAFAALDAASGMGAYAAAKSGVHRLTEALAHEVQARGVTVNAVLPTILDTPANRADMPDADPSVWVTPQALADIMLFLAGDRARAITGALIPVRGGL